MATAATAGESALLPCIKCSGCGRDVEISLMGDHSCGVAQTGPRSVGRPSAGPPSQKPFTLPRIDPYVANKSFLGEDSLTPSSSASGSRVHSPATPKDGQPLQTPSTAYNIAFSLFPTVRKSHNAPDSPTIPSPSHTSGLYASRAPYSPDMPRSPSPNPFNAMSLMARMNTIAPGPFEPGRGSNDKGSGHSPVAMRFPERSSSRKYSVEQALGQGPFGAWEHGRGESGEYRWKEPSVGDCRGDSAPAVPKVLGRSESITDPSLNTPHGHRMTRAVTMPHTAVEPQVPPSPGRSSTVAVSAGSSTTARAPPHPGVGLPRTPSQFRRHREAKAREIPPPPAPPARERSPPFRQLAAPSTNQYEQSQLHAATLSVSSSSSSAHSHLSKSSMSSPPASDISIASRTKGPQFVDPRTFDHAQHKRPVIPASVGEEIDSLMHDLQFPQPLRREGTPSAPPTDDRDARRPSRSTADRETSPSVPLRDERGVRHPSNSRSRVPPPLSKSSSPPPLDPPNRHATATGPAPNRGHKRTPTAKGPCRGCGEQIIGKSISSADGRLSGRYHRACFVCQTCRQPFQSAEFYVLDDLPFCHHHYHELNRSLCGVCNYGIEGPCLETVQRERFHPGCFTCVKCNCPLGDDYYEINGKAFCEHHARRYLQRPPRPHPPLHGRGARPAPSLGAELAPPPDVKVERRRTRLMYMGSDAPPVPDVMSNRF